MLYELDMETAGTRFPVTVNTGTGVFDDDNNEQAFLGTYSAKAHLEAADDTANGRVALVNVGEFALAYQLYPVMGMTNNHSFKHLHSGNANEPKLVITYTDAAGLRLGVSFHSEAYTYGDLNDGAWNLIEMYWRKSSGANDGQGILSVNGAQITQVVDGAGTDALATMWWGCTSGYDGTVSNMWIDQLLLRGKA